LFGTAGIFGILTDRSVRRQVDSRQSIVDSGRLFIVRVHLLYFASFREARGRDEEEREVPDGTLLRQLWTELCLEVPRFAAFPSMPPAAVNREYVSADSALRNDDEVVFLPPVAGG